MRINNEEPSSILLLFLPFLIIIISHNVSCTTNPLYFDCTNNQNYKPNSTFESNLRLFLSSIPSKATTLSNGFYKYSQGTDNNQVYGLALCRGNVVLEVCLSCLEKASQEILLKCPLKEEAIIWYDNCQLRYSYQSFFSQMVYAGKLPTWNDHQQKLLNPYQFSQIQNILLEELIKQVASNSSQRKFATGETTIPGTGKTLGLVEYTPDIPSEDCEQCLDNAMGDLHGCCSSRQGGMVLDRNCNLMFQVSTIKEGKRVVIIIFSVAIPVLVLIAGYCGFYYMWKRKGRQEGKDRNTLEGDEVNDLWELPLVDFGTVQVATGSFSDSNKIGHGGFGIVYKGTLPDGKEIAVKRLSRSSRQGLEEFKNEVILIAKLQHRNLVRLLGCAMEGEEKLLIY